MFTNLYYVVHCWSISCLRCKVQASRVGPEYDMTRNISRCH